MRSEPNPDWQKQKTMRGTGRRLGHDWEKFGREYERIFRKKVNRRETDAQKSQCQIKGCKAPAVVEISGHALKKPGWWRVCNEHRFVFAAQRPLQKGQQRRKGQK